MALLVLLAFGVSGAEARYAAYVVDAETGRVIHASNADVRRHPASLVKMMTLYMAFDALRQGEVKMNTPLSVSARAAGQPASKLGLRQGQTITMESAILALVTKSANDAATVIAEALGGTESSFARNMTRKARALGMRHSTFRNASGLYNKSQLTTAADMATLAIALMEEFPEHYPLFATDAFTYQGRSHRNHNSLLRTYDGADGVKTGYIRAAGYNLVASAVRDGRRLVGVVLGMKTADSRNARMAQLLDGGFSELRIASRIPVPVPKPMIAQGDSEAPDEAGEAAGDAAPTDAQDVAALAPDPARSWGVQVGAFLRADSAWAALRRALRLSTGLAGTRPEVTAIEETTGTLYRSRLYGLSEAEARAACEALERQSLACTVYQVLAQSG